MKTSGAGTLLVMQTEQTLNQSTDLIEKLKEADTRLVTHIEQTATINATRIAEEMSGEAILRHRVLRMSQ
jgi:hypothetical protein